ncbi:MAG: hypothetical protein ABJN42_24830 [Roseibium sp.]|uniref:hypothetical protein n=1 Tax=Roseibium sp. TaxID=1936156 RepID=UPI0032979CCE
MSEKTEPFARLEDTKYGQMLITVQSSPEGPTVEYRLAERMNCEPRVRRGPWPDTEEGWAQARETMRVTDIPIAAEEMVRMTDQAIAQASEDQSSQAKDWSQLQKASPDIKTGVIEPDETGD